MKFRMPKDAVRFETRAVLAGAYRGKSRRALEMGSDVATLTHLAFLDVEGYMVRSGCRQNAENLADVHGLPAGEQNARPTCGPCGIRWDRLKAAPKAP